MMAISITVIIWHLESLHLDKGKCPSYGLCRIALSIFLPFFLFPPCHQLQAKQDMILQINAFFYGLFGGFLCDINTKRNRLRIMWISGGSSVVISIRS